MKTDVLFPVGYLFHISLIEFNGPDLAPYAYTIQECFVYKKNIIARCFSDKSVYPQAKPLGPRHVLQCSPLVDIMYYNLKYTFLTSSRIFWHYAATFVTNYIYTYAFSLVDLHVLLFLICFLLISFSLHHVYSCTENK